MRCALTISLAAALALPAGPALALDAAGIAGHYGDENGRLRCAADGESLEFTDDGRVVVHEHADDPGQPVAEYEVTDPSTVRVTLTDPPGHVIQLNIQGNRLALVGYTVSGVIDQQQLDAWTERHGAFIPCAEMDG